MSSGCKLHGGALAHVAAGEHQIVRLDAGRDAGGRGLLIDPRRHVVQRFACFQVERHAPSVAGERISPARGGGRAAGAGDGNPRGLGGLADFALNDQLPAAGQSSDVGRGDLCRIGAGHECGRDHFAARPGGKQFGKALECLLGVLHRSLGHNAANLIQQGVNPRVSVSVVWSVDPLRVACAPEMADPRVRT